MFERSDKKKQKNKQTNKQKFGPIREIIRNVPLAVLKGSPEKGYRIL